MKSMTILFFWMLSLVPGAQADVPYGVAGGWEPGYREPAIPQIKGRAIRVLFWNTRYNALHVEKDRASGLRRSSQLEKSLEHLSQSKWNPDIAVFSECSLEMFSEAFRVSWFSRFQWIKLIPYNSATKDAGHCLFSKFPLDRPMQTGPLDWRPLNLAKKDLALYEQKWGTIPNVQKPGERMPWGYRPMFERTFISTVFKTPQGLIQLFPVHLMNPWSKYSVEDPRVGFSFASAAIRFGSTAPIYYQLQNLLGFARYSASSVKVPALMIGDFNLPAAWSYGYRQILASGWKDSFFGAQNSTATFPVPSSGEASARVLGFPVRIPIKIDQAFVSPGTQASSVVLPLIGSDHFPIWTAIVP